MIQNEDIKWLLEESNNKLKESYITISIQHLIRICMLQQHEIEKLKNLLNQD